MFSPSRARSKSVDELAALSPSSTRSTTSFGDLLRRPSAAGAPQMTARAPVPADGDDLEMRLDSLHFDSLHFDPDEIMNGL